MRNADENHSRAVMPKAVSGGVLIEVRMRQTVVKRYRMPALKDRI